MSNLRLFGLLIGTAGLIATFVFYRGAKWKRGNFILLSLFNISLVTVSIHPASVNFARDLLALEQYQYGRIIALLIMSTIALFFHSLYTKARLEALRSQFDRLVRKLGTRLPEQDLSLANGIKPIMVLMPALNEAENLADLLPRMPQMVEGVAVGVLVVDDGSEDATYDIVSRASNAWVVRNPINRGGGAALRLGYDILKAAGARICVTMDADGQHRPEDILILVSPILSDQFEVVIGSRVLGGMEPDSLFRTVGVHVFRFLVTLLTGKKLTDPSSGFRAFNVAATEKLRLTEDQYHTSELLIESVKQGLRVGEQPITILKRKYGRSKKGNDWIYGLQFFRVVMKTWWR
ncbi:Glycosyl transferase, family 2 [Olavius algarvensis associated proteobacterium Delta 3]|nr:Glycosyl transferase, family 2 [Olavius algarvensis associated proteobacterium Delta 3]CAB5166828.1 Glycosyl transferase, family 2 [Olavius algarvensis associated proteobacterium Delta 3]